MTDAGQFPDEDATSHYDAGLGELKTVVRADVYKDDDLAAHLARGHAERSSSPTP